jgi:hypothetical protein
MMAILTRCLSSLEDVKLDKNIKIYITIKSEKLSYVDRWQGRDKLRLPSWYHRKTLSFPRSLEISFPDVCLFHLKDFPVLDLRVAPDFVEESLQVDAVGSAASVIFLQFVHKVVEVFKFDNFFLLVVGVFSSLSIPSLFSLEQIHQVWVDLRLLQHRPVHQSLGVRLSISELQVQDFFSVDLLLELPDHSVAHDFVGLVFPGFIVIGRREVSERFWSLAEVFRLEDVVGGRFGHFCGLRIVEV